MHRVLPAVLGLAALSLGPLFADLPAPGAKIVFLGDSVTQQGEQKPAGFVKLVEMAFEQQDHAISVMPAGTAGNTSKDMLARFTRDLLPKKPDWMTLSCGVDDIVRGASGTTLEQYQANITAIVDQATAAGIKVVILTATMIGEDPASPNNQKLAPYNDFLRDLAKKDNLPLADLNADMQAAVAKARDETGHVPGNFLTIDGTHMNGVGDEIMAAGIVKALGFTDAQLAQARDLWLDLPAGQVLTPRIVLSVRQYLQLRTLAAREGRNPDDLINDMLNKELQGLLIKAASAKPAKAKP